jgi:hypothetical protein
MHIPLSCHRLIFAGVLLSVLPWSAPLQETRQETGLRPKPPPRDPKLREELLQERFLGAWQLARVTYKDVPMRTSDVVGYMLVLPDYLSIELHLVMKTMHPSALDQPFFQSGTYRWHFVGEMQLETSSLIGATNITETEQWTFDTPGSKRLFNMLLTADTLVLERRGESKLEFRKLPRLPFPGQPELDRKRANEDETPKDKGDEPDDGR